MDLYSPQVLEESNGSLTISFRQLLVCRAISRLSFERIAEASYNGCLICQSVLTCISAAILK